jgi:hypothetical protein
MSNAIIQVFRVPGNIKDIPGRFVHFPAGKLCARRDRRLYLFDACVPRTTDNVEYFANAIW